MEEGTEEEEGGAEDPTDRAEPELDLLGPACVSTRSTKTTALVEYRFISPTIAYPALLMPTRSFFPSEYTITTPFSVPHTITCPCPVPIQHMLVMAPCADVSTRDVETSRSLGGDEDGTAWASPAVERTISLEPSVMATRVFDALYAQTVGGPSSGRTVLSSRSMVVVIFTPISNLAGAIQLSMRVEAVFLAAARCMGRG